MWQQEEQEIVSPRMNFLLVSSKAFCFESQQTKGQGHRRNRIRKKFLQEISVRQNWRTQHIKTLLSLPLWFKP